MLLPCRHDAIDAYAWHKGHGIRFRACQKTFRAAGTYRQVPAARQTVPACFNSGSLIRNDVVPHHSDPPRFSTDLMAAQGKLHREGLPYAGCLLSPKTVYPGWSSTCHCTKQHPNVFGKRRKFSEVVPQGHPHLPKSVHSCQLEPYTPLLILMDSAQPQSELCCSSHGQYFGNGRFGAFGSDRPAPARENRRTAETLHTNQTLEMDSHA